MAKALTFEQVTAILENGDLDELVGAIENEWLECKAAPYQIDRDHQKLELAKDVSGLANADGGIILIGMRTERDPTHFGDEIKEIRAFSQSLVNPEQYIDILSTWIYPPLDKIDAKWAALISNRTAGILAILVPRQPETKKPFLLTRTLDAMGKRSEIVFGLVERRRAGVDPLSVQGLHTIIRDGLHMENLNGRFESIEETLGRIELQQVDAKSRIEAVNFANLLRERTMSALIDAELSKQRSFALGAIPMEPVEISSIFEARNAEVVRLLEQPPELRSGGFNLDTGSPARIVRGQFRRAVAAGYKILDLWRDGALIFAATGDEDFLCWGRRRPEMNFLRINSLVLIESTYLFAELSRLVFEKAQPVPKAIQFTIALDNMILDENPCVLIPGPIKGLDWELGHNVRRPHQAQASFSVQWNDSPINPGRIAYLMIREVYRWFGIEDESIPYKELEGEVIAISPDQIRKAGA